MDLLITILTADLHVGEARTLVKAILGILFLVCAVSAYIHYNRGDMFDGHSHFRKLVLGAVVSLLLFGIICTLPAA